MNRPQQRRFNGTTSPWRPAKDRGRKLYGNKSYFSTWSKPPSPSPRCSPCPVNYSLRASIDLSSNRKFSEYRCKDCNWQDVPFNRKMPTFPHTLIINSIAEPTATTAEKGYCRHLYLPGSRTRTRPLILMTKPLTRVLLCRLMSAAVTSLKIQIGSR